MLYVGPMAEIRIIPAASDADVAIWLAQRLAAALAATPGDIAITLPGGSTPFPILAELADSSLPFTRIPFARITVWPGDDRCVPEGHPASNAGRLRAALAPLGAHIIPLAEGAVPPRFALAWLGMGADGHVASLFPNTNPDPADPLPIRRLTPEPLPPEAPFARLSLTIPALVAAEEMLLVIRGAEKRVVLEAAIAGRNDLPIARLLRAMRGPVTCFC